MAPVAMRPVISTTADTPVRAPEQAGGQGPSAGHTSFEVDAATVLGELRDAFAALLASVPAPTTSCTEVESALGIDAMLAWQVLRIARVTEPFAAGIKVPARVSMAKLLKAATRRRVPEAVIARVSQAFDDFERLVADHAGTRADFEMMVSGYSPEAREKAELTGKQAAFKGMSQIKGVTSEADFTSYFWMPSVNLASIDVAMIQGHIGIRRIWPGAPIVFSDGTFGTPSTLRTLDGTPIEEGEQAFVQAFSSSPMPQFKRSASATLTHHTVTSQDLGLRSAIDLVRGTYRHGGKSRFRIAEDRTHTGMLDVVEFPTKRLTVDAFLHESVYPGVSPELAIYDTTSDGLVTRFNDPEREHDRMQLHETIRPLGKGLAQAKLPHIPRYTEMLQYVCAKRGLNASEFRGYRLDVLYPVYGAEYMWGFRLPDPPGAQ